MLEALASTSLYTAVGVAILAIFSLVGLILFASREPKFEDVVAAQKKEQDDLLSSLLVSKKSGKSKKWSKLKQKKKGGERKDGAEDVDAEADSGLDDEEPSAESISNKNIPAIPEPEPAKQRKPKKVKKLKISENEQGEALQSVHSGLQDSKRDGELDAFLPPNVSVPVKEVVIQPVAEETVRSHPSLPEVETIVATEEVRVEAAPDTALTIEQDSSESGVTTSAPKKNKSKLRNVTKPDAKQREGTTTNVEKLQKDVEAAVLDASQVQELINALLLKQSELDQWQKPGQKADPIEQLKRQIQDYEASLMEEKKISASILQKSNNLRAELIQERAQLQNVQQLAGAKLAQQAKEMEALRKRMDSSQEKHLSDMQSAQAQIARMQELIDGASSLELHKLKEEANQLKKASIRAQQLSEDNNSLLAELSSVQKTSKQLRLELENALAQYQQAEERTQYCDGQLKNIQLQKAETEKLLNQRLQDVNEKLLKVEAEKLGLEQELITARQESEIVKVETERTQSCSSDELDVLQAALNQKASMLSHAETRLHSLEHDLSLANHKLAESEKCRLLNQSEIADLQSKLEMSLSLKSAKHDLEQTKKTEALEARLQEYEKSIHSLEVALAESKREAEQLQKQLDQEISGHSGQVEALKKSLEHSKVNESEEIVKLRTQLQAREEELEAARKPLEDLKAKNNELREKNWKAMDAVGKAEASCQDKLKSIKISIFKGLKKLHPQISIPDDEDDMDVVLTKYQENWLSFSERAASEKDHKLEEVQAKNLKLEEDIAAVRKDLIEINIQLQLSREGNEAANNEVNNYKRILSETETMLSGLQERVDLDVNQLKARVEEKTRLVEERDGRIKDLESDLKTYKDDQDSRCATMNRELEEKTKYIEAHLKVINEKEQQIADLESKLQNLQNESDRDTIVSQEQLPVEVPGESPSKPKKKHGIVHTITKIIHPKTETELKEKEEQLLKAKLENEKLHSELELVLSKLKEAEQHAGNASKVETEFKKQEGQLVEAKLENEKLLAELGHVSSKLKEAEQHIGSTHKAEAELKEKEAQLAKAKSENEKLHAELGQVSSKLKEAEKLIPVNGEAVATSKHEEEVKDLNAKLKKTTSERDLLIREYKNTKEAKDKLDGEVKKLAEELSALSKAKDEECKALKQTIEGHDQEIAKLKAVFTSTEATKGKGDKDKDKVIAKLRLEIEDLKEELREERDRVVVDIETPVTEELQHQVEALTSELQSEKNSKLNLSLKLNDLEKSFHEEQSDKDKVLLLESKLKAAESKVNELEAAQAEHIKHEIAEAMDQMKRKLSETAKLLEAEQLANKQLKDQLAAAVVSEHGTSV